MKKAWLLHLAAPMLALISIGATAGTIHVSTQPALVSAIQNAQPGTTILVAPGTYPGGMHFNDIHGTASAPIVVAAEDPANPPVIQGGVEGMKFSNPAYLQLKSLSFEGSTGNDISIDDGGSDNFTAHDLVLDHIHIINTAYGDSIQGIKLTGVKDVRVEACQIDAYPVHTGEGVDVDGGENVVITGCTFKQTYRPIQLKGGVEHVQVTDNHFIQPFVGHNEDIREAQIGGQMGPCCWGHFKTTPWAQARDVTVAGNTFIGSQTPVLFNGSVGGVVEYNTFYRPGKWIFRILRENQESQFAKTQGGVFKDNIIVYRTSEMSPLNPVNIGPDGTGVLPGTFTISHNWWYAEDDPANSQPHFSSRLPAETGGVYGINPELKDPAGDDLSLKSGSPAAAYGAGAWQGSSTSQPPSPAPSAAPTTVPQSQMRVIGVSSQQSGYGIGNAIDGNSSTFWHSQWGPVRYRVSSDPQWVTISLGQTYSIDALRYLPRQGTGGGSENGIIIAYKIYTSTDGTDFTQVAAGDWADDKTEKTASFAPTQAAYIKLVATAGVNDFASAAAINVDIGSAVPQAQMEVAAVSSQQSGYGISNAFDGNASTFWHSQWGPVRYRVSADPQSVALDLGGTYNVNRIAYLPRQDAGPGAYNGVITGYKIYTSTDGTNFTQVASGHWDSDKTKKFATFAPTKAAYIKFVATAGVNDFASAAAIRVDYAGE